VAPRGFFIMVTIIFEIFAVGILLAVVSQYYKNVYLMALSALWYIFAAMTPFSTAIDYSVYGLPDSVFTIFYVAIAALLAVNSWFYYERTRQSRDRQED